MKATIGSYQRSLYGTIYIRYLDTNGIDYEVWVDSDTELLNAGMEVPRGFDDDVAIVRGLPAWLTIA